MRKGLSAADISVFIFVDVWFRPFIHMRQFGGNFCLTMIEEAGKCGRITEVLRFREERLYLYFYSYTPSSLYLPHLRYTPGKASSGRRGTWGAVVVVLVYYPTSPTGFVYPAYLGTYTLSDAEHASLYLDPSSVVGAVPMYRR